MGKHHGTSIKLNDLKSSTMEGLEAGVKGSHGEMGKSGEGKVKQKTMSFKMNEQCGNLVRITHHENRQNIT